MLDTAKANAKTAAINDAFAVIGSAGDTGMPRSRGNLEPIAYEYHVASHLKRIADARQAKAAKAAIGAGVIFDPEKDPRVPGTAANVYAGDVVVITLEVGAPQTRLDVPAFLEAMTKAGVQKRVLDRAVADCTRQNRAPHKFTSALATK